MNIWITFFVIGDMLVYKSTVKFVASFNIIKKKKRQIPHTYLKVSTNTNQVQDFQNVPIWS